MSKKEWEGRVYFEFRNFLLDKIGSLNPDALGFEAPFTPRPNRSAAAMPLNPAVSRRSNGFVAHIVEIAEECDVACHEYQSSEIVKFFTGKGRFPGDTHLQRRAEKKDATMAACKARGWKAREDEADALAGLMLMEYHLYPEASLRRRMVLKQPVGPLFSA